MQYLSLRVLFLCVFLPPVLYIFSIQGLESALERTWKARLEDGLIGDPDPLLQGKKSIHQEIRENIHSFLAQSWAIRLGAVPRIAVRSRSGRRLYPGFQERRFPELPAGAELRVQPGNSAQSKIARENAAILQDGLVLSLSVDIPRNTWLSNSILIFYIFLFSGVLIGSYSSKVRKAESLARRQQQDLAAARERLLAAEAKEQRHRQQIEAQAKALSQVGQQLEQTEQEALEEMEALEAKLQESVVQRQEREQELERLALEMEHLRTEQKTVSKKKKKQQDLIHKRFRVLYKNSEIHERAVQGFVHLPEDIQLQAEELIQSLDRDPGLVKVKRKVFTRKGDVRALESLFAYRGRIYWRNSGGGRVEILAVGTKKTQARDLQYLEGQ